MICSLICRYLKLLVVLSINGGAIYLIFDSLTYCVQDLGLDSINLNGTLLGLTQTIGYIIIFPVVHKLKRKLSINVLNILTLVCSVILFLLSKTDKSWEVKMAQSLISNFGISIFSSQAYLFFIALTSESYPTEIRGAANALIFYISKLIGSTFPYFKNLSIEGGLHVMVCSTLPTLIAIPLMFLVKETLVTKIVKKE